MKKKIAVLAVLAICIAAAASGTLAYFTASDTARNVITAGSVKIQLNEMSRLETGELVPFENQSGVMPGQQISKIVTVENAGDHAVFVRLVLRTGISLDQDQQEQADSALINLDLNTADWTQKDGVFYYNRPLAPGEETEPLFTTVTFSKDMGNVYQNSTAMIGVVAQAAQVANNGNSALTAAGWPEV